MYLFVESFCVEFRPPQLRFVAIYSAVTNTFLDAIVTVTVTCGHVFYVSHPLGIAVAFSLN